MAKGAQSKEAVIAKLLEVFPGSFQYDKEFRIPMVENGEEIQIKVALTCAKTNVEKGEDTALPGETVSSGAATTVTPAETKVFEQTEEEKANLEALLKKLDIKVD